MAIIKLPQSVKNTVDQCLIDLIDVNVFGASCTLVLPPIATPCGNCVADPIGGKSSNIWLSGGPQAFEDGQICPMCAGEYIIQTPMTIPIVLVLEWEFDKFLDILKRLVRYPQNSVQTRGYGNQIANVKNCSYLNIPYGVDNYRYKLAGEPIVPGKINQRFFYAVWERI